jgi:hypothetical protein
MGLPTIGSQQSRNLRSSASFDLYMYVVVIAMVLLATPAFAQVTAEPASVSITADIIRANIRLSSDQEVVLTAASLVDKDGRAYQLADRPSGIPKDEPGGCVVAGSVAPRQLVSFPFKASGATTAPFTLILELQTPDAEAPGGCRSMNVTIDDLQ